MRHIKAQEDRIKKIVEMAIDDAECLLSIIYEDKERWINEVTDGIFSNRDNIDDISSFEILIIAMKLIRAKKLIDIDMCKLLLQTDGDITFEMDDLKAYQISA